MRIGREADVGRLGLYLEVGGTLRPLRARLAWRASAARAVRVRREHEWARASRRRSMNQRVDSDLDTARAAHVQAPAPSVRPTDRRRVDAVVTSHGSGAVKKPASAMPNSTDCGKTRKVASVRSHAQGQPTMVVWQGQGDRDHVKNTSSPARSKSTSVVPVPESVEGCRQYDPITTDSTTTDSTPTNSTPVDSAPTNYTPINSTATNSIATNFITTNSTTTSATTTATTTTTTTSTSSITSPTTKATRHQHEVDNVARRLQNTTVDENIVDG